MKVISRGPDQANQFVEDCKLHLELDTVDKAMVAEHRDVMFRVNEYQKDAKKDYDTDIEGDQVHYQFLPFLTLHPQHRLQIHDCFSNVYPR